MTIEPNDLTAYPPITGIGDLNTRARELFDKLDEMTSPPKRRQERDALRAEDVAQAAGVAEVGAPDTRMAGATHAFRGLLDLGYVERAKNEEGEGGIRYRISQLGEREMLYERIRELINAKVDLQSSLDDTRGDKTALVTAYNALAEKHRELEGRWRRRGIRRLWR